MLICSNNIIRASSSSSVDLLGEVAPPPPAISREDTELLNEAEYPKLKVKSTEAENVPHLFHLVQSFRLLIHINN